MGLCPQSQRFEAAFEKKKESVQILHIPAPLTTIQGSKGMAVQVPSLQQRTGTSLQLEKHLPSKDLKCNKIESQQTSLLAHSVRTVDIAAKNRRLQSSSVSAVVLKGAKRCHLQTYLPLFDGLEEATWFIEFSLSHFSNTDTPV
jgi:hypothetical protein